MARRSEYRHQENVNSGTADVAIIHSLHSNLTPEGERDRHKDSGGVAKLVDTFDTFLKQIRHVSDELAKSQRQHKCKQKKTNEMTFSEAHHLLWSFTELLLGLIIIYNKSSATPR